MSTIPSRPRLADHVFARRHRQGGERFVVLHDTKRDVNLRVQERAWLVIGGMDGTRDLPGLVAFAVAKGAPSTDAEVEAFVTELAAAELVEDGVVVQADKGGSTGSYAGDRPVLQLPGFMLSCDGRGTCCRFYPTVVFSPLEAARARARLPLIERAGLEQHLAFSPLAGTDDRLLAVALVDGRCAYLDADGACGVHRAGSAAEKPLGCRVYPARFVDDGQAVRASPWLECTCVLASGTSHEASGEQLTSAARGAELDPAIFVERLPERVRVGEAIEADTAALAELTLALTEVPITDGVAALWSLATALDAGGLDAARDALTRPSAPDAAVFSASLEALAPRIDRLAAETWRSPEDLPRQVATALVSACALARDLGDELLRGAGTYREAEAFYVRALLFGHQLVSAKGKRSMAASARDRALRVLLGRALGVVASMADLQDPAFSQPLALVEASMRAYGLVGYVNDAAEKV